MYRPPAISTFSIMHRSNHKLQIPQDITAQTYPDNFLLIKELPK
jgi:hypothetical protein